MDEISFEAVETKLQTLKTNLAKFEEMKGSLGVPGDDSPGLRKRITKEKKSCNELTASLQTDLQTLRKQTAREGGGSNKERYTQIAKDWGKVYKAYEKARKEVEIKEKSPPPSASKALPGNDEPEEQDHHIVGFGGGDVMQQIQPMQAFNTTALHTEEDIQREKKEDLLNMEQDVNELNTIYHEFHDEVKKQEDGIVEIAANVTSAANNVNSGTAAVQKASGYQKSSRKKMCCIGVLLLIIIIIIVVVVAVAS